MQVSAGEDLEAWRALSERAPGDDKAIAEWQRFIEQYPSSALAERAWASLHEAGPEHTHWSSDPAVQATLARLERSWYEHQQTLQREPSQVVVASLHPDGTRDVTLPAVWTGTLAGGMAAQGLELSPCATLRLERGPLGAIVRVQGLDQTYGAVGLRVSASPWGPYAEASASTLGGSELLAGGRYRLGPALWLEGSGGVALQDGQLAPALRVELAHTLTTTTRVVRR